MRPWVFKVSAFEIKRSTSVTSIVFRLSLQPHLLPGNLKSQQTKHSSSLIFQKKL